ncbi:CU044_2847 family protein [Streptomyces sp. V4-01]|uniref:CU044_2847 family protein n=1 Tax=Actinacidiphila polyblastidii TaxID=3110430 RepID=A0ABU7PB80_9ACTN|nr:CU044_2847 family protein [Streptomyces sp. V4-01]
MNESRRDFVKAELPTGETIWVRVAVPRGGDGSGLARDTGGLTDRLRRRADPDAPVPLTGFTEAIHGIARSVHRGLQSIAPDTVEIEFGLDVEFASGELVSMLADVHATSSIRVTIGWEHHSSTTGTTAGDTVPADAEGPADAVGASDGGVSAGGSDGRADDL